MTNRFSRLLFIGFIAAVVGFHPESVSAQVQGSAPFSSAGTTAPAVTKFLKKLQRAVADEDANAVAALVSFPLRAWNGKKTVMVKNKAQFIDLYPSIFRADLCELISEADVSATFANSQGVMLGSGRIWFSPDESDVIRIITVNSPE